MKNKNTNILNVDSFYSCRDEHEQQQEQYVSPQTVADYTDVKTAVVIIPRAVERCAGWNDIEIIALQQDRNDNAPMRFKCRCLGNEAERACFYLTISARSMFVQCAQAAGIIDSGKIELASFVGQKYQARFEYDTYEQDGKPPLQYLKLVELSKFVM